MATFNIIIKNKKTGSVDFDVPEGVPAKEVLAQVKAKIMADGTPEDGLVIRKAHTKPGAGRPKGAKSRKGIEQPVATGPSTTEPGQTSGVAAVLTTVGGVLLAFYAGLSDMLV